MAKDSCSEIIKDKMMFIASCLCVLLGLIFTKDIFGVYIGPTFTGRIDCRGVPGINLTHDDCVRKGLSGAQEGVCQCDEIIHMFCTSCPCLEIMESEIAKQCKDHCPVLFSRCHKEFVTTTSNPTRDSTTVNSSPPTTTSSTQPFTSKSTRLLQTDRKEHLAPILGVTILFSLICCAVFVWLAIRRLMKYQKCLSPCCKGSTECVVVQWIYRYIGVTEPIEQESCTNGSVIVNGAQPEQEDVDAEAIDADMPEPPFVPEDAVGGIPDNVPGQFVLPHLNLR